MSNMSDQEQIEMLKRWWKEYGVAIISGVVLFLIANYAIHYWHNYKSKQVEMASLTYSQFLSLDTSNRKDEANVLASGLERDYKHTPYASLAAFFEAKDAVHDAHFDIAEQKFNWIISNASDKVFRDLARVRLARVLLEEKKPEQALIALNKIESGTFKAEALEIRGDVLVSLGKRSEADAVYKEAIAENITDNIESPLLKMKI